MQAGGGEDDLSGNNRAASFDIQANPAVILANLRACTSNWSVANANKVVDYRVLPVAERHLGLGHDELHRTRPTSTA
ncbi:MAG: hypothetical protein U0800_16170 [Isosphaeraceae bacterium]